MALGCSLVLSLQSCCLRSGWVSSDRMQCSFKVDGGRGSRHHPSSRLLIVCSNSSSRATPPSSKVSKIVTFVGKGGVGKTFSAVLAAQYYASLGLRTALAVQSQDPTAEFLLGAKLGTYSAPFKDGALSAFKLDATKLLQEPWSQLKQADGEQKFSQGALDEVVSDELGILPGMDSILAIGLLDRLSGFTRDSVKRRAKTGEQYDVIVYDGPSSEEILRIFGAAERARWYLKRLRSLAEKTDTGRVAIPSILKAVETSILDQPGERSTAQIWASLDSIFNKTIEAFADRRRFGCYLVTSPANKLAHESALRYWGCATHAGMHVSGALSVPASAKAESAQSSYSPLTVAEIPYYSFEAAPDWKKVLSSLHPQVAQVFQDKAASPVPPSVAVDTSARTVTLFLPGFPKSEIKLSQWQKNSELLVEAGDQRRSIYLPSGMQGKVVGAKFLDKSLLITIGSS